MSDLHINAGLMAAGATLAHPQSVLAACRTLRAHNAWRRYNGDPLASDAPSQIPPDGVGRAIDLVCSYIDGGDINGARWTE